MLTFRPALIFVTLNIYLEHLQLHVPQLFLQNIGRKHISLHAVINLFTNVHILHMLVVY